VTFAPRLTAAAAVGNGGSSGTGSGLDSEAPPLLEVVVTKLGDGGAALHSSAPLNNPGDVSGYDAPASTPTPAAAASPAVDDTTVVLAWGEDDFADRCYMLRDLYGAWHRGGRDVGVLAAVVAAAAGGDTGEDPLHYTEGDSEGGAQADIDDEEEQESWLHDGGGGGAARFIGSAQLATRPLLYGLPTTGRFAVTAADGSAAGHIMASLVPCMSSGEEDGIEEVDDPMVGRCKFIPGCPWVDRPWF